MEERKIPLPGSTRGGARWGGGGVGGALERSKFFFFFEGGGGGTLRELRGRTRVQTGIRKRLRNWKNRRREAGEKPDALVLGRRRRLCYGFLSAKSPMGNSRQCSEEYRENKPRKAPQSDSGPHARLRSRNPQFVK